MYYVNLQQIEEKLNFIPFINDILEQLAGSWDSSDFIKQCAQERALHLAIETVTDVGSLLIDGFMMRDASSYEDIIDVLAGEQVFTENVAQTLSELVKLRKPLVQDYVKFPRHELHRLTVELPGVLKAFAESVPLFIKKELGQ
jgi:uncharacterized protein YutE (UPF0331/DUF86 family)